MAQRDHLDRLKSFVMGLNFTDTYKHFSPQLRELESKKTIVQDLNSKCRQVKARQNKSKQRQTNLKEMKNVLPILTADDQFE